MEGPWPAAGEGRGAGHDAASARIRIHGQRSRCQQGAHCPPCLRSFSETVWGGCQKRRRNDLKETVDMGLATPHPIPRALWEPQTASFMQIRSDRLVERITQSPLAVRGMKIQAPHWWVGRPSTRPFYFEQKHSEKQKHSEEKSTLVPATTQRATRSPQVTAWSLSCSRCGNRCPFETAQLTLCTKVLILMIGNASARRCHFAHVKPAPPPQGPGPLTHFMRPSQKGGSQSRQVPSAFRAPQTPGRRRGEVRLALEALDLAQIPGPTGASWTDFRPGSEGTPKSPGHTAASPRPSVNLRTLPRL